MQQIAETIIMSDSTALLLKSIGVIIAGLLVSSGRLDANQADAFANNVQIIGGLVLASLGGFYLLEHAFQAAMAELKWSYGPDTKTDASSATTETSAPPEAPAQPTT